MTCGSCSAEIDDKAIVCYRCGAPTALPVSRPPRAATAGGRGWVAVALVVVAIAVAIYLYLR